MLGTTVLDVAALRDRDDLLLVLAAPAGRLRLQLAPGGTRARITLTARRFRAADFATGPRCDALRKVLVDAVIADLQQPGRERRVELTFGGPAAGVRLVVELFGARGLWCVLGADGTIRELSRPVATRVRSLRPGDGYAPPPPLPATAAEPAPRFAPPVLPAVDAHFTQQDQDGERQHEHERVARLLTRARERVAQRLQELENRVQDSGEEHALRAEADLMLAYAHTVPRGAAAMTVPDPADPEGQRTIELDPARPVPLQAQARYDRARRLRDGAAVAAERLTLARREAEALDGLHAKLTVAEDMAALEAVRVALAGLGHGGQPATARPRPAAGRKTTRTPGRHFVSTEGYPILVGRSNEENDRITLRVARGNDLWLHVGGGRAGSHVVVRLPKGRTASLDTLLDAATLAVHFSKARGERTCEVVYTQARHVRKPKGLPPGRVVPHQVRSLTVRLEEDRLRRLLDSAVGDADSAARG